MPPHPHEDPAAPPGPGAVDALIMQARRLRGQVDAVRREVLPDGGPNEPAADAADTAEARWRRALCELAVRQLDDLGEHLDQLRDHLDADPAGAGPAEGAAYPVAPPLPDPAEEAERTGSAEWNLLTDAVEWSPELYRIFGRTTIDGPLTLDELPSWLFTDDQQTLAEMVTGCLVDGRPINGEFRIVRPDGSVRAVHMTGEAVLDPDGNAASMWAVLRDVSELRRSQRLLSRSREALERRRQAARAERRLAIESQQAVLPAFHEPPALGADGGPGTLDLAGCALPSGTNALIGGDWYDAMPLADGGVLLSVGDLTGHGVAATTRMAMLMGVVRGLALAGAEPGELLAGLNRMLDAEVPPTLGSALCCRYQPAGRTLTWAQAGHPPPLVFRDGVARVLPPPEGVLLGAAPNAEYGQQVERLRTGDLLVLHTDGLLPALDTLEADDDPSRVAPLLALAPRLAGMPDARTALRVVLDALGRPDRDDDACVLVARVR